MSSHLPPHYTPALLHRYLSHFNRDPSNLNVIDHDAVGYATVEERAARAKKYNEVAYDYYDLVSPLYEQGWGQRFHYTPIFPGKSIADSMTAYEHEFARIARLKPGMKVVDLGAWHVKRGTQLTKEAGLEGKVTLIEGNFLRLPFEDESFDAAYSVESLCYAPEPAEVYREIKRVLKPGAPFTFHDFAMTEKFDENKTEHAKIRNWVEFGNGIVKMPWVPDMRRGVLSAGFELLAEEDMAGRSKAAPWYYGPAGDVSWAWRVPGWDDFFRVVKMSPFFLFIANSIYRVLILFGFAPPETLTLMDTMLYCCRSVAIGGKMGIFTPMYVFTCRKPIRDKKGDGSVEQKHGQKKDELKMA
ncbi:S-adenosyl-L-methionine-dependent methyltransferase [Apiosordaria backusii]|uniref:S-adenosyl-L-methionine-dependent methyltransferase n=1 Tax=Apiosordaria backusii TaxID=314023 RepID=A0AA40DQG0_9PEZI|nr:S-adenosyl-L-methionine-dependent methyltransferase [Apiosordaria backusii]